MKQARKTPHHAPGACGRQHALRQKRDGFVAEQHITHEHHVKRRSADPSMRLFEPLLPPLQLARIHFRMRRKAVVVQAKANDALLVLAQNNHM